MRGRLILVGLAAGAAFFVGSASAHAPVYNFSNAPGPVEWFGHVHADVAYGSRYGDWFYGEGGPDRLYGQGGIDVLRGNEGDDYLSGGAGFDICYPGPGLDIMSSCEDVR